MGKNLIGGKKNKRCKNNKLSNAQKVLVCKEDDQDYGIVTKMLGDSRLLVNTGQKRDVLCIIRGKLKKKVWINNNDLILISYRDYQDNKADVILKYNEDDKLKLRKLGELNGLLTECKKEKSLDELVNYEESFDFDDL